ncbi:hypothetical protein K2173_016706 [Erythroxylum novogranatense]|uniref:Bet v I/Major latex protein domain-containing protein n=1 Tax=Erythroxylum novogranatense TaxID=1862640 RepID=A0AAV8SHK7_9ROSI|nr:hypothetical protein K2173_016706 [Erythroxylum novogranatense]
MSLLGKLEADVEIKSPAGKFHDVFSCRPHHVNTMSPDKIHGVDLHEGHWGKEGTVITWNYTHDGVKKTAKEIVEAIDDNNNSTTFRVIDGDLMKEYKDFRLIVQATPKPNGEGSVVHWTLVYQKLHPQIPDPATLLEFAVHCSKDVDAHLTQTQAQK